MPIAPQTMQPRGPGQPGNRVDFLRGLDRTVQTRQPGRPGQPYSPQQGQGQMVSPSPQIMTPSANQVDGTSAGIPNLGRLFSESLLAPAPQLRSMIPAEQMQQPLNSPQPSVGMKTQGY